MQNTTRKNQLWKIPTNIICNIGSQINTKVHDAVIGLNPDGQRMYIYKSDDNGVLDMVNEAMKVSRSGKAMIESLWIGSEHTVETLFDINGKFHECFITDRIFDKTDGFALETGLVHPTTLPIDVQNQLYELAYKVAVNVGINQGAAKFDMMMTVDGPRIIEMTVRLSGGFDCQYLVHSYHSQ